MIKHTMITLAAVLLVAPSAHGTGGGPGAARKPQDDAQQRLRPQATKAATPGPRRAGIIAVLSSSDVVRVKLEHLHVAGPLPAAAARSMLRGLLRKLEGCFVAARTHRTRGVVQLTVDLSPAGAARVALRAEPQRPAAVDRCIRAALAAARWPQHPAASRVVARLAHRFEPPANALGGLIGSALPPAGAGLGLRGSGKGGGGVGCGTGSIGLGKLGRIGHGSGSGSGSGVGWRRRPRPLITLGQAVVGVPQPSKEIIRRVVRRHLAAVRHCYERYLIAHPQAGGTVQLRFVIDAQGQVVSASAQRSTFKDDEVPSCLARQVRSWRFPAARHGGLVNVVYPFTFRPADLAPVGGPRAAPELN